MKCLRCGSELTTGDGSNFVCRKCENESHKPSNLWQLCPKCGGQGSVWFPTNMPLNPTFAGDGNPYECDVCKGKKLISAITGLPPI
jgi:hypothetical protein